MVDLVLKNINKKVKDEKFFFLKKKKFLKKLTFFSKVKLSKLIDKGRL